MLIIFQYKPNNLLTNKFLLCYDKNLGYNVSLKNIGGAND